MKDRSLKMAWPARAPMAVLAALSLGFVPLAGHSAEAPVVKPYPQATSAVEGQPNISGLWKVKEFYFSLLPSDQRRVKTMEGVDPPLQPWAQALYDQRAKDADAGTPYADTASHCLPTACLW